MIKLSIIIPVYNQEELIIRALKSIPPRKDIEILVIDDGSTDRTFNNVLDYKINSKQNIVLLYNQENMGVSYTLNRGYDLASGEYIILLGSDDYFYTEELEKLIEKLDGTDLIYFDLRTNDGTIFHLTQETKKGYCGSTKAMRNKFIGDTRCPVNVKSGEDYFFYQELLEKNPTEKFTNLIVKHYNYPRENSLFDLKKKGKL